jgi:hypothetical protein
VGARIATCGSDEHAYLLRYLLTYSMVQSSSWEANRIAASQETHRILLNPKVYYKIHNSLTHILSQLDPVHIPTTPLPEDPFQYYPSVYAWVSQVVSLPQVFSPRSFTHLSFHPYALHAPPISYFSILLPAQYWVRSTWVPVTKALCVMRLWMEEGLPVWNVAANPNASRR